MEIRKLENSSVELTLTLASAKIEEEYSKSIKDYARKLTLKGFRPGKAPVSLIENKFGKEIREEITFKLMEQNLEDSYKDMDAKDRPLPYSTPELQNEDKLLPFQPNTDITYSVIYDVMPQFTLPAYTGLEVKAPVEKVTEKQVGEEIERIRQQNAMIIAKNGAIAEGDIVTMNYAELDSEGKEVESTKRDDFTFTVGSSYNFYKLDKDIVGMKAGETKVIEKTYGDDSGMGTDYLGKTVKINVSIKEVKQKEVPELDDEFAQDVKDSYKTLADMKADIKKQLQEKAEQVNKDYKLNAVLEALADKTEISIPKSMITAQLEQEWRSFAQRFGMPEEEVERLMSANGSGKAQFLETRKADTEKGLKVQLIVEKVKEEQNFQVSDEELENALKNYGTEITKDSPNYDALKAYAEDDVKFDKAKNYLVENNKFTELKPEKAEKAEKPAKAKKTAEAEEK